MVKYLGVVSYLGSAYKGFERQKDYPSIQGKLEDALHYLFGKETLIHGAGRTDAGVHAKGQTFSFEAEKPISDISAFVYAFNRLLPGDILVRSIKEVPLSFDARHSCMGKRYSYTFRLGTRDPFDLTAAQLGSQPFDEAAFRSCLSLYLGKHNFEDFTTKAEDKDSFLRTITTCEISAIQANRYTVSLIANGFMTYMVRILLGVAFKVAGGKLSLEDVQKALDPKERKIISFKAPACGLTLEEVFYE